MAIKQPFPGISATPFLNQDGTVSDIWNNFLLAMYNRTGGTQGNDSSTFNYPSDAGSSGQILTSSGSGVATIWKDQISKVSQLTNDSKFINIEAVFNIESDDTPQMDNGGGGSGTSTDISRADHVHPSDTSKVSLSQMGASISNPGYFSLPSGLIIGFGSSVITLSGTQGTINYGFTFPNSCITFIPSNGDGSVNTGPCNAKGTFGTTASVILCPGAISNSLFRVNWIAIGS